MHTATVTKHKPNYTLKDQLINVLAPQATLHTER